MWKCIGWGPPPAVSDTTVMCASRLSNQFEFKAFATAWEGSMGNFPSGRGEGFQEQF